MLKIDEDGCRFWYNKKGKLHRVRGPAVEWPNGTKMWYKNGKKHRIDGPACERNKGMQFWYINDKRYSEKQYKKEVRKYVRDK